MNSSSFYCFPGEVIQAQDKRTQQRWEGTVNVVALELGERKLLDTKEHTISKPARALRAVGSGVAVLPPPKSERGELISGTA
ncbi:hypothetical protein [Arthrobacter sp. YN]|uniref:hypothetical protein n=1 Tax=Arthrobacter sp. YN TaxID=2020486 RepID=UPI000B5DDAAE|nr:hypothetical protein [Arthrobacter sp. YN]ASN19950.1 hypothetical protein CGK93_09880 [Arthrobacter sp. YN]